ncbi:DUF6088 family protein [Devosia sp.]|uniref:DUF6088 family protein n=1 Tax=Devosia sp. TaxID=1871048 RepID=UPI0026341C8F|nr:DUF6088 family protein [Devosia sp.]
MSVVEEVRGAIKGKRSGSVISASMFANIGSREAVDQALSRLRKSGELMRVARGIYVRPVNGKFGTYPPHSSEVVRSLKHHQRKRIVEHGLSAANQFGLTTQQPLRQIYLTNGSNQVLKLGSNPVILRHAPEWQTIFANRPAGAALRALSYVGRSGAVNAARQIKAQLPEPEWEVLTKAKKRFPAWVANAVVQASNG